VPFYKSKLELKLNLSEILPVVSLTGILPHFKLAKPKLEVFKSDFQRKKKDINTDKFAINWQNFAQVRLQLKFAFMIRH